MPRVARIELRGRIRPGKYKEDQEINLCPFTPDEQVDAFDNALATLLAEEFPEEPLLIEHRVWAVITRKPGKHSP